jgi:tetrapyrrole methylase family protein/MazG family protein
MSGKHHYMEPTLDNLLGIIRSLRAPDGCPWDRKQTHESLKSCMVEEVAEFLDAVDNQDYDNLREELGDLLMNLAFHTVLAEEEKLFDMREVLREIIDKMIRRHPHVFADVEVDSVDDVMKVWAKAKAAEKGNGKNSRYESVLDGVPRSLSALLTAREVQKKGAKYGFDWECQEQIVEKIDEEVAELKAAIEKGDEDHIDEEIGDLLFSVVNLTRFRKRCTSEDLLSRTIKKFRDRFRYIEDTLKAENIKLEDASLAQMDELWNQAKNQ